MNLLLIFFAKYLFLLPIIILGVFWSLRSWPSQQKIFVFAGLSLLVVYLTAQVAGHLYFDPRPFVVGHFTPFIRHAPDNGFPSDHALLVFTLASIGFFLSRKLGIVLLAIALLVAVARVYVGLHHPIDVIGSALISIVLTSAVYLFLSFLLREEVR